MKEKNIEDAIKSGNMILTTKDNLKNAIIGAVSGLYNDVSDFHKNRYMTSNDREFEQLSSEECNDIANDIIEQLTKNSIK